jgi:phage host-nuclease inhibitor protein Gam
MENLFLSISSPPIATANPPPAMPKKSQPTPIANHIQFEHEVDIVAYLLVEIKTIEADYAACLQDVHKKFGAQLAGIKQHLDPAALRCKQYAEAHRAELFAGDAKSAATPLAEFGFRAGQPHLKPMKKFSWEKVLVILRRVARNFVRTKYEIDRELILAQVKLLPADGVAPFLAFYGLRLVQDESFWIEPKAEEGSAP